MIPVIVDDLKYHIRFEYSVGKKKGRKALANIKNKQIVTLCEISRKPTNNPEAKFEPIVRGKTQRDKNDPFIKSDGRALALRRAMGQLNNIMTHHDRKIIFEHCKRVLGQKFINSLAKYKQTA